VERLQQSIARARQEREGKIGKVPAFEDRGNDTVENGRAAKSNTSVSLPSNKNSRVKSTSLPPNPIHYDQTRVVQLDEQHIESHRIIAGQSGDERVEAYRQLRTQVLQTLDENNWNTLAITSPLKNAGKTLTAVNLAISLAKEVNHTVLLVDLDLSHPDVHNTMGLEIEYGLIDVLEGRASVQETLVNPAMQRLVVMPCLATKEYSSEILTSPAMAEMLQELRTRYANRIIIFDLPPLLRNDDALKFTPFVDATLLVVEAGETTPDQLERSTHLMKNANLIGTILNKVR